MKKGFTLVEMIVAIAIFSVVVAIGVGGFAHALHTQGQVSAFIAAQSNASIALEQMAREIRTGYLFCDVIGNDRTAAPNRNPNCNPVANGALTVGCTVNSVDPAVWTCNNLLEFYNGLGQLVDYALAPGGGASTGGALERNQGNGYIPITGDNVVVKYLSFTVFGNTEDDNWPPRITIAMGVVASSSDPAVKNNIINLQTTVSARSIDCTQGAVPQC